MESVELAAAFDRAVGERLIAAERLILTLPELFRGTLQDCDLAFRVASHFFVVVVRIDPRGLVRGRLEFWCGRAGGRVFSPSALPERDRSAFYLYLGECDFKRTCVTPGDLPEAAGQIVTQAGATGSRRRPAPGSPSLVIDVGGPGWEGIHYDGRAKTLFLPGGVTPPVGDELALALRFTGLDRPLESRARVSAVRSLAEARPGSPAGFTLSLVSPPEELLAALAETPNPDPQLRAAPRYPVIAPVKIAPEGQPAEAERPSTARIEYATDQELAADYMNNLSQGGAFIRTSRKLAVGSRLSLEMRLPAGAELKAPATVVFTNASGMGVKFELDEEGQELLAGVIARISARPRRALVVDDDALARRMLADALSERGFEVLSATDGADGLRILTEELLALDVLLTDVNMPNMDGETFVRTIRRAGGENELTILAISGRVDEAMEKRLEDAGSDAVLEKGLGPELIAQAADAALERKRLEAEAE